VVALSGSFISSCPNRLNTACEMRQADSWMSALGQKRTLSLFDYFIGKLLELVRHVEPQRLGGRQINDEFVFCWGLYRQIDRLLTLKNAQGCATASSNPTVWYRRCCARLRWTASSLRADMIFGKDTQSD
jgi:hypothetical protein